MCAALRVLAERRVVVRRAGRGHVAQRPRLDARARRCPAPISQSASAGGLAEQPLLEAGGEDVGDRLVERAGLVAVDQPGGVLGDGVGELVAEHVDRLGEPAEDLPVAVAEDQLGAVPERVVVVLPVVHGQADRRAVAVVRRPPVDLLEQRQRAGDPGRGLVDRDVARRSARRRSAPGRRAASVSLSAVCTIQAGRGRGQHGRPGGERHRAAGAQRLVDGEAARGATRRSRYGGTKAAGPESCHGTSEDAGTDTGQGVRSRRAVRREAAGGHRAPASTVIRISDLPCLRIASRYSSQSACSPAMQRKYSTSPSSASGRRHVQHLGGAVDLDPGVVPLVGEHQHGGGRVPAQVHRLGAVGVGRDHDPALGVDAAGDRRDLRAPVGAGGHEHQVVAGADEVEELVAVDAVGGGDLGMTPPYRTYFGDAGDGRNN